MHAAVCLVGLIEVKMTNSNINSDQLKYLGCRDVGKLRQEGKEHVVQDGDVLHFRLQSRRRDCARGFLLLM